MVQKHIVELVDDLDGGSADVTLTFALDGKSYELDLSAENAEALRLLLAPYVDAGRRSSSRGKVLKQGAAKTVDIPAVRQWALDNGYQISSRGRIPAPILAAYESS